MADFYSMLGIERNATDEEIRRAYKRKARLAHPDRPGGDTGAMAALNRARDVLLDPVKREAYDLGGDEGLSNASQAESQAREVLRSLATQILDQAIENNSESPNPLQIVRQIIEASSHQCTQNINKATRAIALLKKAKGRIQRKGTGDNIFESIIDDKLASFDTSIENGKRQIAALDEARRMLEELTDTRPQIITANISSGPTFANWGTGL